MSLFVHPVLLRGSRKRLCASRCRPISSRRLLLECLEERCVPTVSFNAFPVSGGLQQLSITDGPDNNLWFTNAYSGQIGRSTTEGSITLFPIPTSGASPRSIAAGPDGNLWFTEGPLPFQVSDFKIGRITTAGTITEFPLPANSQPLTI